MFADGHDAGRCSNALNAQKFREAMVEEHAIYRKWLRGSLALYVALLMTGFVAVATYSGARTQLTELSVHLSALPRANQAT